MKSALLIGGGGPTGPHIARGLVERGFGLTLLNRGIHSAPGLPAHELIRADPHFPDALDQALRGREFDLVIATYGRTRHAAQVLAGRCARFLAVGGTPVYVGQMMPGRLRPFGARVPLRETDQLADRVNETDRNAGEFSHLVWQTEQAILRLHEKGAFAATLFRYPRIYGPRQLVPVEWSIVKRVRDGRRQMILADGGLTIQARCAARNAAQFILLALDRPEASNGQIYNCADDVQVTWRQLMEEINAIMDGDMAMLSMPERLAGATLGYATLQDQSSHVFLDITKARLELGYADVIEPRVALEETVAWLLENPIADSAFPYDRFDYAGEDRLIAAYQSAMEEVEYANPCFQPVPVHAYPHPREPGLRKDHKGR